VVVGHVAVLPGSHDNRKVEADEVYYE
jgi:hypothetical protein